MEIGEEKEILPLIYFVEPLIYFVELEGLVMAEVLEWKSVLDWIYSTPGMI